MMNEVGKPNDVEIENEVSKPTGRKKFKDWNWNTIATVGAFIVAFSALFRPDIEPHIRGEHVIASLPKEFIFNHRIGVLWVLPWVDIRNEGGKRVDIKEISIFFKDVDGNVIKLIGDSYLNRTDGDAEFFPWTTLSLNPGNVWVDRINFREPLPAKDEEEFRRLVARLGELWNRKLPSSFLSRPSPKTDDAREIEKINVQLQNFFSNHFKLQRGKYKLLLVLKGGDGKVIANRAYDLILFDSAVEDIKARLKEYTEQPSSFFDGSLLTSVPLTPIEDDNAVNELQQYVIDKKLL